MTTTKTHWTKITLTDGTHDYRANERMDAMRELRERDTIAGLWACSAAELAEHDDDTIADAGLGRGDIDWTGFDVVDDEVGPFQIRALREEALAHGDDAQVRLCDVALGREAGDAKAAWAACAEAIAAAKAMAD